MGSRSLLSSDTNPRRKRSFTLPSFRKTAAQTPSVDIGATAAQEAARIRKAAAWQWYTRSVGEVVVPTKRPLPAAAGAASVAVQKPQNSADTSQKKDAPPALVNRAASRFKAEASASGPPAVGVTTSSTATPPNRTPLYDEFELSGLKSQMADFVHRLQQKPLQLKAKPQDLGSAISLAAAEQSHSPRAAAPEVAEASGRFRRPMAALHRLFRKVISFQQDTLPFSPPPASVYEEPPDETQSEDVEYHYHHYIHHHHHHYHYGPSPEQMDCASRRRRHSESSGIRPRYVSASSTYQSEDEEGKSSSPINAFLARRRRYSDSAFAEHIFTGEANCVGGLQEKTVKPAEVELQLPRRHSSERFTSRNKEPNMLVEDGGFGGPADRLWPQKADIKSMRRHATESFCREDPGMANVRCRSMKPAVEAEARGGGGNGGGVYKLGGAGGRTEARPDAFRRRHSESRQVELLVQQELMYGRSEAREMIKKGDNRTFSPASCRRFRPQPPPPRLSPQSTASLQR